MPSRSVLVCEAQVPFVHGGAELLVRSLVDELRRQGDRAERVSIPFKWYPKGELLAQATAWRLVDLSEANGTRIDAVIATKFPTDFVRHPNKVTWLCHQHRPIYELCGTPDSEFTHEEADVRLRDTLIALDREMLTESARLFTIAHNVAARLERYGYVTLEAFLARKPVVTTGDAGGPLEFVEDGVNGLFAEPTPESLGAAISRRAADRSRARQLGDAGYDRARSITWDGVVQRLMGAANGEG